MRRKLILLAGIAAVLAVMPTAAGSAVGPAAYVEVWTDKGEGEIYERGEQVDIYVLSSFDAYVLVYEIDTDGYLNVIFPYDCSEDGYLTGGRTHRILSGGAENFRAGGSKGVAYIRALASATPFRRLYWPGCRGYERYEEEASWTTFADYWGPALPPQISGDPYVAMQSIDEFVCWDAINAGAVSVDYTFYYVSEVVERPVYYVYTGWRWPHTWYWPCWDVYWNVCWDACWGVSISLGSWYPCFNPCGWSWCAPTWCAPSWCWPTWYSPRYAYCGPRGIWGSYTCWDGCYTCCGTGNCGICNACTGTTCRTYPSQYKYKTNTGGGSKYRLYTREGPPGSVKTKRYAAGEGPDGLARTKQVKAEESRPVTEPKRKYSTESRSTGDSGSAEHKTPVDGRTKTKSYTSETREPASKPSYKTSTTDTYTPDRKTTRETTTARAKSTESTSSQKTSVRRSTSETPSSKPSSREPSSSKARIKESDSPVPTVRKSSSRESSSRKESTSGKSSSIISAIKKTISGTKISGSGSPARASSPTASKSISSSSGSSGNHRGSPKTRRSVSR